ncbi:MAG: ABC transporter permease [Vulcanisaeta sp.]|jgi:peptide/nickel transport system permease protein|uniref:ABC transporter permease n=1 Tax=Vulcanisaeta sp. TaxID=2020871 RepID=UPI003D1096D0
MARRREFRILGMTPHEISREFLSSGVGKVALTFFIIMVVVSLYALIVLPPNFSDMWNNPNYWRLNPPYAPPSWINSFLGNAYAPQLIIDNRNYAFSTSYSNNIEYVDVSFTVNYNYKEPWRELYVALDNPIVYGNQPPVITITITRPDGKEITIGPLPLTSKVTSIGTTTQAIGQLIQFYQENYQAGDLVPIGASATPYIFYNVTEHKLSPLFGTYKFSITIYAFLTNNSNPITSNQLRFILQGDVYGLMGADFEGRDLWLGLLAGFPVDLAVGLLSALIVVVISIMVGVVSAFFGGFTDEILTRVTDFVILLPAFPLLIVFSVLFGWNIWDAVIFLALVSWGASARIVRVMVMQIKTAQYIESAIIAGANRLWILRNHVLPQIVPYVLYLLVTNVPGAILTLSAINFLGLAGSEYPTWGNILYYAEEFGALTSGYWWWVIPPGLLIAFVAVVFIITAIAMEPIVNPRLRYG